MDWTVERVIALAPDVGSAKAGRSLASAAPWRNLGQGNGAIWGECQGSGATPYQTRIALAEPAFKCTCPSRKFPCKHAIGLLLLHAQQGALLPMASPPAWVAEWLQKRDAAAERRASPKEPADAETVRKRHAAHDRRAADREARVASGLDELDRWLADLLTQGLAAARQRPSRSWDAMAARMIDAQAPGVARLVAECTSLAVAGEDWAERLLHRIARLHLLSAAHRRLDQLPTPLQADIRSAIGWSLTEDEVRQSGEHVVDEWFVLGRAIDDDGRLRSQRVWLRGRASGRPALLLDFAPRGQNLPVAPPDGTAFQAELHFYPSALPLRALLSGRESCAAFLPAGHASVATALTAYAEALARNPMLERFPMLLDSVAAGSNGEAWWVQDKAGDSLPLRRGFQRGWELAAIDGGHGARVFGEWDGMSFTPITVFDAVRPVTLAA